MKDESEIHSRTRKFNACKQPVQGSSFSEIKSATLNSSFFQNGFYSPIFNMQFGKENQFPLINSETERIHNILGPNVVIKQVTTVRVQEKIKKLIIKFIKNLMQQTYYYKEGIFNQFQKVFLTEKYLEEEIIQKRGLSLMQQFVWEIAICTILVILLGWLPLQLTFSWQQTHAVNAIIIVLLCLDFLKSYMTSKNQNKKREYQVLDIIYIISFIIIQYGQQAYLQQLALMVSMIISFKKLEQKYQIWSIYIEFDLHYFFVICKLLLLIHYCACIFRMIWIEDLDHRDSFTIYCYSFYWSTASLLNIGQSIIRVETQIELVYSIIIMLLSCYVFSYILYHTTNFIKDQERQDHTIRKQLNEINKYFKGKTIPLKLKGQIRNFLKNQQTESEAINSIVSKLPLQIKEQLFLETRQTVLNKCLLLKKFSDTVRKCLTQHMEEIVYPSNQTIEQTDQSLYIIQAGKVQIIEANKIVGFLNQGETFGEYQFFTGNQKKTQYKTQGSTQVYKISPQEFMKIVQYQNLDFELFIFIKHSLLCGNYQIINLNCKFCESNKHLISDCPLINYKPNIERLIKYKTPGTQFRQKNKRNDTFRKRINNQVLARLKITCESLKLFREQNNLISYDDDQSLKHLDSDRLLTSNSNNRIEASKEGTTVSILRQPDQPGDKQLTLDINDNQEDIYNKKQLHQKHNDQAEQQYRVSLWPIDPIQKKSYTQLEQFSLQELVSDGLMDDRKKKKSQRFSLKNTKVEVPPQKTKFEDSETLNFSNRLSEEQQTNPLQGSQQNNPQTNRSTRRASSQIIPNQFAIFQKPTLNPLMNTPPQFMDLEINNSVEQEFENMRDYQIYYPLQNCSNIVKNANYQQIINQSNYSFKTRVQRITQRLQIQNQIS